MTSQVEGPKTFWGWVLAVVGSIVIMTILWGPFFGPDWMQPIGVAIWAILIGVGIVTVIRRA